MSTGSGTDGPKSGARQVATPDLSTVQLRVHDAIDLAAGVLDTVSVDGTLPASFRVKRLDDLGFAAESALFSNPAYRLTAQVPYQAAPEAWLDAFDGSYGAGPAVDRIWWRLPPSFATEFTAGCNFSLRQVPAGPSVISLVFDAWPHQGATGVVVVDVDAQRTEIPISLPVARTVDIGFTHDGTDTLSVMVFFRPGIRDFVFHSLTLGTTNTSGSIAPWPTVKANATGHPVRTLQYLLRARGHAVVVDGVFGPDTEAAARAFQASHGLTADGVVAATTWLALVMQVRMGSTGDAVRGVQEEFQFRNLSGDPGNGPQIDGVFGPVTDASVRGFQQALSLDVPSVAVDGIVGPVTWQALVSGMLSF